VRAKTKFVVAYRPTLCEYVPLKEGEMFQRSISVQDSEDVSLKGGIDLKNANTKNRILNDSPTHRAGEYPIHHPID